jgi:CubicO group peptidase (beta-lactamase class C family)
MAARRTLIIPILLVSALLTRAVQAEDRFPGAEWAHIAPAEDGWSDAGLADAKDWSNQIHSTAVMVIHRGMIVAEWGDTTKQTELASVRKSFLSALIGIAVGQGKMSLDSSLGQLGIDDNAPSLTDVEKTATVRMLLEARSGVYHPALYETAGEKRRRPQRYSHRPGTFWYYNNWDFNALGTVYEHATGVGIYDAIDQQIARPIGMQDYRPKDGTYVTGEDSIHRAYPFRLSARDLARFGLLYLNHGNWAGKQIVPAAWVQESTQAYSRAPDGRGYGHLWWTCSTPNPLPEDIRLPRDCFFALGAGGQYDFVIPSRDMVIVNRVDRDQHLPEPTMASVAYLVQAILAAHQ